MKQIDEKAKRVKYIRALEKFAKSAISGLKRDDFNKDEFYIRIDKNIKMLEKAEAVYLDSPYTKELENFVNFVIAKQDPQELLKKANHLDKLKNSKTYKKDKHKNKFKEN
ncbi:hypothetical protein [Campylobacter pinnipediorum]|uniref:hypothetical protein n=1 Tax=Campylobacter pinnipediorum TaxID=1965231 RepID=UPI00084DA0E1|nr:hypothetical protein [Campylobacter pinnipediorum]AQW82393.1 hypothetical protein CPIN17261_0352 [Campylobacter pinnipediorum subsp. pinnipediorum]